LKFLHAAIKASFTTALIILTILLSYCLCSAKNDEETYDISLVKTAEVGNTGQMHEVDGKKVLVETYTVKDGDHLWQILREKKLLDKRNLSELISVLKKLNGSLDNIDMIHPGEKIIIPLVLSPIGGKSASSKESPPESVPLEAINDVDLEEYVVRQGDSIIKIVEERYDVPHKKLYNEYLSKLKEINPFIKDINSVYPGQKIKLPIYSPTVVKMPIKGQPAVEPMTGPEKEAIKVIAGQLGEIFTLMGEQWLQTGEHFFPLKASSQLKLNASAYPIIDLTNGNKILVDLYNDLPEKMEDLITSNWNDYKVIHLDGKDDLKTAFSRVVQVCGYRKIYGAGEPFVSDGETPVSVTADRIVEQDQTSSSSTRKISVINFLDDNNLRTPEPLRKYLESSGIKIIDYPSRPETEKNVNENLDLLSATDNLNSFIKTLLDATGQIYKTNVELPVYQNERTDINLAIKADFFIQAEGKDHIIDLSGLGKEIINVLQEHQMMVCSILGKRKSSEALQGLLEFLGIKHNAGTHQFSSENTPDSHNISITIEGITFKDANLKEVFATSLKLPRDLIRFLNAKGYRVFQMPMTFTTSN
jgi:hypothetical protein